MILVHIALTVLTIDLLWYSQWQSLTQLLFLGNNLLAIPHVWRCFRDSADGSAEVWVGVFGWWTIATNIVCAVTAPPISSAIALVAAILPLLWYHLCGRIPGWVLLCGMILFYLIAARLMVEP